MKNEYHLEIRTACPVHDGQVDIYQVTVISAAMIPVETILAFFQQFANTKIYQEELTAKAAVALGAGVELVGMHSGIRVRSVCP